MLKSVLLCAIISLKGGVIMSEITADMLYEKLLEKKRSDPNRIFDSMDINGMDAQFQELLADGRVKKTKPEDVTESFIVIG